MKITLPFHHFISTRPHLSLALLVGGLLAPFLPHDWTPMTRTLVCWDTGVWFYIVTMCWMMMRADQEDVKRVACQQDERSPVILAILCAVAVASLAAIVSQLSQLKDVAPGAKALHYALVIVTLLGSWFLVGVLFCFHYAHLYYTDDGKEPPLTFPDPKLQPNYWDFLYFAFTISVAVQTSDVIVRSRPMRQVVLGQSVLCFFFNLVILGLSINIAASLINN